MKHSGIIAAGMVLVLIIVGMFVFTYLKKIELQEEASRVATYPPLDSSIPYGDIEEVTTLHHFANGTHTVTGELEMPTPCDLLEWEYRILESYPEHVIIDFEVVNHSEVCADVRTPQKFEVKFVASENAVVRATIDGREIKVHKTLAEGELPLSYPL